MSQRVCKFYPLYCQCVGHVDSRSNSCGMFGKTKAEKDAAMAAIQKEMVESEAAKVAKELTGTYQFVLCIIY